MPASLVQQITAELSGAFRFSPSGNVFIDLGLLGWFIHPKMLDFQGDGGSTAGANSSHNDHASLIDVSNYRLTKLRLSFTPLWMRTY